MAAGLRPSRAGTPAGQRHEKDTLAEALHYSSRTSISHIERGREGPPLTKILACALELEVHPHELFLEEPHEDAMAARADQVPSLLRHLLAMWQTLAEDDREILVGHGDILRGGGAEIRRSTIDQLRVLRRALRAGGTSSEANERARR
jgi:DNA-binding XRE family transcriptional regulator